MKGYSEGKRLKYYQANWGAQFVIGRNTIFLCTFDKRPTVNKYKTTNNMLTLL